jgi:hypothetical protein
MTIDKLHAGDPCPRCHEELFEITAKTRDAILSLHPKVHSVPEKYLRSTRSTYVICPFCDAYACGRETVDGFELIDKQGNVRSIHQILDGREY